MSHSVHLSAAPRIKKDTERKRHYRCSDRITACSRSYLTELIITYCWDEKPNSQRPTRTKVIQTTQETLSGHSGQLGRCDCSEVARITLTSHPLSYWQVRNSLIQHFERILSYYRNKKHCWSFRILWLNWNYLFTVVCVIFQWGVHSLLGCTVQQNQNMDTDYTFNLACGYCQQDKTKLFWAILILIFSAFLWIKAETNYYLICSSWILDCCIYEMKNVQDEPIKPKMPFVEWRYSLSNNIKLK